MKKLTVFLLSFSLIFSTIVGNSLHAETDGIANAQEPEKSDFELTAKTKIGEITLSSASNDFEATQPLIFNVTKEKSDGLTGLGQSINTTLQGITGFFGNTPENKIEIKIENKNSGIVETQTVNYSGLENSIQIPTGKLKPGNYTLTVTDLSSGTNYTQDFTWGVLAINFDRAIYTSGDTAIISIAVLDEKGEMVCDASLNLAISNNSDTANLSTSNGSIKVNEACLHKEFTLESDYEAKISDVKSGTYNLSLNAQTSNGTYQITDSFEVKENVDFEVGRVAPTRIYPRNNYPVMISVTPNVDFEGFVEETLPKEFTVSYKSASEIYRLYNVKVNEVPQFSTKSENDKTVLYWQVNWKKGKTYQLAYDVDFPDKSPDFYLGGPLKFRLGSNGTVVFSETRQWQYAIDASGDVILFWDSANGSVPGGWTCISCGSGDFFGVMPRGAATYGGTTAGADTHTNHTLTYSSQTAGAAGTGSGLSGAVYVVSTHTHTWGAPTEGSGSVLPPYQNLNVIYANNPATIPANVIGIFDTTSLPTGWSSYTALNNNGYYLRGGNDNTPGGATTHVHSITLAASGSVSNTVSDTGNGNAGANAHTHSLSGNSGTANNAPPFVNVYFAYNSSGGATEIPDGLLALFNATPPTHWSSVSGSSPYSGNFLKGATSSIGSTGGSAADHNHSATITSSTAGTQPQASGKNSTYPLAGVGHTHDVTYTVGNVASLPVYRDTIIGKYTKPGDTFSGDVYTDSTEGSPLIGASVCLAVNATHNAADCNTTDGSGHFSITSVSDTSVNDQLTFFIDGGANFGNTVTVGTGNDITTIKIYQNNVIVRHDQGTSIAISQMDGYDSTTNDTDMLFDAVDSTSDTLTVEANIKLYVPATYTFDPNGTVTLASGTGDFDVRGTAYLDTSSNSFGRDILIGSAGTLYVDADTTVNGGDVTVTTTGVINRSTGTGKLTMVGGGTVGGGSGNITLYDLETSTSGTTILSGSSTNTITNNVTAGAGTTMQINNNVSIAGNFNNTTTGIISYSGTPTVTMTGASKTLGTGSGAISLYNLATTGTASVAFSGAGTNTISNDVTVGSGTTLNINSSVSIAGNLNNTTTGIIGTTAGTPTITMSGTTKTLGTGSGAQTYYALNITGSVTFSGAGTNTVNNNVTVATGGTFNINNNISIAGNLVNTTTGIIGTTSGTPTVTFTGSATIGGGSGAITFYNLATSGTGTSTFSGSGTNTISNDVTVGSGTTLNINSSVSIAGNLNNTTTGIIGTTAGTPTITMSGTTKTLGTGSGNQTYYALSITGSVTYSGTGTTKIVNNNVTVATGATFNINSDLTIAGNLVNTTSGIIGTTTGTPTVTFTGSATIGGGSGAITFYNLATSGSGTSNFSGSGTNTFNSNITVGSGTTLNLNSSASIAGNFVNTTSGIIGYTGTPTITMTGTGNSIGGGAGSVSFYNLTINPSSAGTITANSNMSVSNTLNVASGDTLSIASGIILTHSGATLTLDGTISGAGTYTYSGNGTLPTSGTLSSPVRFDATNNAHTVVNRSYGGNVEFYSNSSSADRTFTLGTGASQTITFSGNVTLNAAGANATTIAGASNNPTVNITGNLDSTAGGGVENITTGSGTWTVSGNVDLTDIGTFTSTSNTFQMNGSGATVTSAGESFNNFAVTGGSVSNVDSMDINGTFSVTTGSFTHGAGAGIDIYIAGNFTLSSGTTWVENITSTSDIIFSGDLNYTDNTATKQSIGNVIVGASPDTINLTTDFAANSLSVTAADFFNTCQYEVNIGDGGITIAGTFDASATGNAGSVSPCNAGSDSDESTINDAQSFTLSSGGILVADASTIIMDDTSGTDDFITAGTGNPYILIIQTGGATIEVEDPLTVTNNLTITSGTLDVVSGENNQINVGGNWTNDATFVEQSGKVVLDGTSSVALDSNCSDVSACTNENFYDLEINKTSATDANDNVTLTNFGIRTTNSLTITDGEFVQGAYAVQAEGTSAVTITSLGKWTNVSTGDLTLGGSFSNEGTAIFQSNGSSCGGEGPTGIIISSTDTNQRSWTGSGTFTFNMVEVDYQTGTATIINYGGSDGGHNGSNWQFTGCPQTISGNVYNFGTSSALSACDADTGTYELRLRSSSATYSASCSNSDGSFSFSNVGVPAAGGGIVIWIDHAEAPETDGALIVRYDGVGNSTLNTFYGDAVTVTSDDTNAVTIDNMNGYDYADDADIPYTATNATPDTLVVNSGYELLIKIKSGVTADSTVFDPGGSVETNTNAGDLHIAANTTAYLDTTNNAIGRDIEVDDSATLYINGSTSVSGANITTSGTGAAVTRDTGNATVVMIGTGSIGGGTSPTFMFYNLRTLGTGTTTITNDVTINNDLIVQANTTLNANGSLNVAGNLNNTTSGIINVTSGTPTLTMSGLSKTLGGGSGNITLYNVTIDGSVTFSGSGTNTFNNNLSIGTGGALTLNNALNIGGNYSNSGTFTANSNTITMTATGTGHTLGGTMTGSSSFYDLVFNDGGNSGAWTFGANSATVTHSFVITGGAVTAPSTTLTIAEDFTNDDSFIHNSGTVVFNNIASTSTLTYSAPTTFNNFTVATAGKQMQFDNDSQTNIAGLFNIQGSDCTTGRVFLDSDIDNSAWEIYVSGTSDVDYVDIEDSTAITTALTADSSSADNDSNTNWTINSGGCIVPTPTPAPVEPYIRGETKIRGGTRILYDWLNDCKTAYGMEKWSLS